MLSGELICPVCCMFGEVARMQQINGGKQGRRYRCQACQVRLTLDKQTADAAMHAHLMRAVTPAEGCMADGR